MGSVFAAFSEKCHKNKKNEGANQKTTTDGVISITFLNSAPTTPTNLVLLLLQLLTNPPINLLIRRRHTILFLQQLSSFLLPLRPVFFALFSLPFLDAPLQPLPPLPLHPHRLPVRIDLCLSGLAEVSGDHHTS